jgi:tetratricopeptide (TPR) repeat protein
MSYALRSVGSTAGNRGALRCVLKGLASVVGTAVSFALVLAWTATTSQAADNATPTEQIESTNLQLLLRNTVQIQQELQATHLALERGRQEAAQAASQNAESLSNGLRVLHQALSDQEVRETEARQRSDVVTHKANLALLLLGGTFAAIGIAALLLIAWFQWSAGRRLAQLSTALPQSLGLGPATGVTALGPGDRRSATVSRGAPPNLLLLGAIEQLDKRLLEFKGAIVPSRNGDPAAPPQPGSGLEAAGIQGNGPIPGLLQRARSLLNGGEADAALARFDEVLSLAPNHTEALVGKGAALERLQRLNEAIACYDRAIAADGSMTLAYLHKGGLCNRLERFKEALECYEKALHTHEQRVDSNTL